MALGGGTFTAMDKILPGTYINIVSAAQAVNASIRGVAAIPMALKWGISGKAYSVEASDLETKSLEIFGYDINADEMKDIREVFRWADTLIVYNLAGGGTKASGDFGTAKYSGTRGNSISLVVAANVDDSTKYDVTTKIGTTVVDKQTVASAAGLVDNAFVEFDTTATLSAETDTFSGGTDTTVTGTQHTAALAALEHFTFNCLGCIATEGTTIALYTAFTKRMRDERGMKFQCVVYNTASDYEGVINVASTVSDSGANSASLVYWVTGAEAACELGKNLTNALYDGEYTIATTLTQAQLEAAITAGKLVFHQTFDDDINILKDINSLTTFTDEKSKLFARNETIRTIDYLATEISSIFAEKYMGDVANTAAGRTSLWSDIVTVHRDLEMMNAITDFDPEDLTIDEGEDKGDVVVTDAITLLGAMEKLYMTVVVD